jgi:hypothetical protein
MSLAWGSCTPGWHGSCWPGQSTDHAKWKLARKLLAARSKEHAKERLASNLLAHAHAHTRTAKQEGCQVTVGTVAADEVVAGSVPSRVGMDTSTSEMLPNNIV